MFDWIQLFAGLTESEKSTVELFAQERIIKAGEILFHEGDDATAMYGVKSWLLNVYRERSVWDQILWKISSGEIVWEMALFDEDAPKRRLATVRALEDTHLVVIVDYAIVELWKKHPRVHARIRDIILERKQKNKQVIET